MGTEPLSDDTGLAQRQATAFDNFEARLTRVGIGIALFLALLAMVVAVDRLFVDDGDSSLPPPLVAEDFVPSCIEPEAVPFVDGRNAGYDWNTGGLQFAAQRSVSSIQRNNFRARALEPVRPDRIRNAALDLLKHPQVHMVEVVSLPNGWQRLRANFSNQSDLQVVTEALGCSN